jgi:hypothetical protein
MNERERDEQLAKLAADPFPFIKLCWPNMRLYEKQREVLMSVCQNPETFVHAANKTGKTHIAALIAIWFYFSRTPARVIITSSSESQLRDVLWAEILNLTQTSVIKLPFMIRDMCLRKMAGPNEEPLAKDYLAGHVPRSVESFQGHHLEQDKPRVLFIFDEASAIPDELYEAAQSCGHRILVIGNPLATDGFFYCRCKQGNQPDPVHPERLLRKVFHISARDVPNVELGRRSAEEGRADKPPVVIPGLLTYDEYVRRQADWDEERRTTRLDGQFYEGKGNFLFPASLLDAAMDRRRWNELGRNTRRAEAMGVDVASGGRDRTCWTIIDQSGVIEQLVANVENSMEIVGRTIEIMRRYDLLGHFVAIDAGGGGKQIADRLREQGHWVQSVWFGEAPQDKLAYVNRRAELYGTLAQWLNGNDEDGPFALPPDANELRAELAILPRRPDSEGRLRLPSKERGQSGQSTEKTIRQLLGRSPDRADSLVLAVLVLAQRLMYPDVSDRVLFYDFDGELTAEEMATMPPELRALIEMENEPPPHWKGWKDEIL